MTIISYLLKMVMFILYYLYSNITHRFLNVLDSLAVPGIVFAEYFFCVRIRKRTNFHQVRFLFYTSPTIQKRTQLHTLHAFQALVPGIQVLPDSWHQSG